MPESLLKMFSRSPQINFDIELEFKICTAKNLRSKDVLDKSIDQHAQMCIENTKEFTQAKLLSKLLYDDIESRVKRFVNCLGKTSKNYREWLVEDYKSKLNLAIGKKFRDLHV